nr:hypothetical protein [Tanacetum cinerariifolium]
MVDEQLVIPAIEEIAEPEEEEEDLAALFGEDDNFEDDDSEGFDEEKAWEVNEEWLIAPVTPPPVPARWVQVGAQVEQGQQTATQRDETVAELTQQGEHTDAVHFEIGEMDCSIEEKTTRTPVMRVAFDVSTDGLEEYFFPEMECSGGRVEDDEAYKERKCKLLSMTYRKPSPILIEKVEVTRYTVGPGESYTKFRVIDIDEMLGTRDNFATIRARLIEETNADGGVQKMT